MRASRLLLCFGILALIARGENLVPAAAVPSGFAPELQKLHASMARLSNPKTASDVFLSVYEATYQAEQLSAEGKTEEARVLYEAARLGCRELQLLVPDWNPAVVAWRLEVVERAVASLPARAVPAVPPALAETPEQKKLKEKMLEEEIKTLSQPRPRPRHPAGAEGYEIVPLAAPLR